MQAPKPLTAKFAKDVTTPGVYSDGRRAFGLRLVVRPSTDPQAAPGAVRKSWTQRLTVGGRARHLGIGPYPLVTLTKARAVALDNARAAHDGHDPRAQDAPTFTEAAAAVIELHAPTWKPGSRSESEWRSMLGRYAAAIASKPVDRITPADIVDVLRDPWNDTKSAGRRLAHRLTAVMDWAIGQGWRSDNPVAVAVRALPRNGKTPVKHHPAVDVADAARVLAEIRQARGNAAARWCMEFVMLTAARSSEAREMTWVEVDTDARTWTVPAHRLKTQRPHRVPLSDAAMALLERAHTLSDGTGLVFPSARTGRAMHTKVISDVLRTAHRIASVHGMRQTFKNWTAETGVRREVAELCLAHAVPGVEGHYLTSDLLDARRTVMADWANHLHA